MKKLTILIGLALAVALALPGNAGAAAPSEVAKLTAFGAQADDEFGIRVAVRGATPIGGAERKGRG